jgi:hypothetical protein
MSGAAKHNLCKGIAIASRRKLGSNLQQSIRIVIDVSRRISDSSSAFLLPRHYRCSQNIIWY